MGIYAKSDSVLHLAEHHLNNYDTELLAADNALSLNRFADARKHFIYAHNMLPVRFMPLYGLMQCALQQGDTLSAEHMARAICGKAVKVSSSEVTAIQQEAKCLLQKP